jgi:hypothetical protein
MYGNATAAAGAIGSVNFLYSTDGVNFQIAASGANQGGGLWTGVWAPPSGGKYYLRMVATGSDGEQGKSAVLTYTANSGAPQISTPTLSIGTGTYGSSQNVTVSSSSPGVQIFYTTDGSNPSTSATRTFLGAGGIIPIYQSTTLKIQSFYGSGNSSLTTATYTITGVPAAPWWMLIILAVLLVYFAARLMARPAAS